MLVNQNFILADGRWNGPHGIGRFSTEVLSRLQNADIFTEGPNPLSLANLFWQPYQLRQQKKHHKVFYSPGFNPILLSPMPYVFTICDLIHLEHPGKFKQLKQLYYEKLTKPSARKAYKIITISEYSKQRILEWLNVPEEHVVNVSCGVDQHLSPEGPKHLPGYPYLLHIGNTKAHKNVVRLIEAFAQANIAGDIHLVLTGNRTEDITQAIQKNHLEDRVVFSGVLDEAALASYYRGAVAVAFPSLIEGFGLPPLEAMAYGTPALTSNTSSLPEVTGDAAILVDPYDIHSIAAGIEQIVNEAELRKTLIAKGLQRVKLFSWDATAAAVQQVLNHY